jgi:mRNA interferase MazF
MHPIYDAEAPPRVKPRVIAAPRIRQIYWCRLPVDAELPELWKVRPVIIISYRNLLHGHATVIATTTVAQPQNE